MIPAGPDTSLYISITPESAIHHPPPLHQLPFLPLFVFLLCWHVTRQDTAQMACPSFWLAERGGVGVHRRSLFKHCCRLSRRAWQLATETGAACGCHRRVVGVNNNYQKHHHLSLRWCIQAADHLALFVSIVVIYFSLCLLVCTAHSKSRIERRQTKMSLLQTYSFLHIFFFFFFKRHTF